MNMDVCRDVHRHAYGRNVHGVGKCSCDKTHAYASVYMYRHECINVCTDMCKDMCTDVSGHECA